MDIKDLLYTTCLGLVCLLAVDTVFSSITFSKSASFLLLFLALYVVAMQLAKKIRIFFIMPDSFLLDFLLRAALLFILFWVSHYISGGITMHVVSIPRAEVGLLVWQGTKLEIFGTIVLTSVCISAIYEFLIFLKQK